MSGKKNSIQHEHEWFYSVEMPLFILWICLLHWLELNPKFQYEQV